MVKPQSDAAQLLCSFQRSFLAFVLASQPPSWQGTEQAGAGATPEDLPFSATPGHAGGGWWGMGYVSDVVILQARSPSFTFRQTVPGVSFDLLDKKTYSCAQGLASLCIKGLHPR